MMIPFRSTSTHDLRSTVSGLKVCRRCLLYVWEIGDPHSAGETETTSTGAQFEQPSGTVRGGSAGRCTGTPPLDSPPWERNNFERIATLLTAGERGMLPCPSCMNDGSTGEGMQYVDRDGEPSVSPSDRQPVALRCRSCGVSIVAGSDTDPSPF